MSVALSRIAAILIASMALGFSACAGGSSSIAGNEGGSEPVGEAETVEYKKALVRCYKMGGSRVVKIMGSLRCY